MEDTGYDAYLVKDNQGNDSLHYAQNEEQAAQAHVTHWGVELRLKDMSFFAMVRSDKACLDKRCLDAVNMPTDIRKQVGA